jgi:hypothetical protein
MIDTPSASKTLMIVLLGLSVLALGGCSGPFLVFPGGRLGGEEMTEPVADWSFADSMFMDLELRPDDPYSVTLNYFVRDGKLYVDPAEDRQWYQYLKADDRVRVRFGFDDRVYPLRAVLVGKPGELEGFDSDRYVYRLDPR